MTLAVRLRCTCRSTLATFDHGAEVLEPAKRAYLRSTPWRNQTTQLMGSEADTAALDEIVDRATPELLDGYVYRCGSCNRRLTFSASEFDRARQRAQVTGKAVDIMPSSERRG
jgi:hypothetical protein